jgi:hypothetical protein
MTYDDVMDSVRTTIMLVVLDDKMKVCLRQKTVAAALKYSTLHARCDTLMMLLQSSKDELMQEIMLGILEKLTVETRVAANELLVLRRERMGVGL